MFEARSTITTGGRMVIPYTIRRMLNLNIGEELVLKVEKGELHISTLNAAIKETQELVRKHNKKKISLSEALIASRREEARDE